MARVDEAEVGRLARLAKIELEPAEIPGLAADLEAILGYVASLAGVDTDGVAPMAHATGATLALRPDEPAAGLSHDDALAAAPETEGGGFSVPHFVE